MRISDWSSDVCSSDLVGVANDWHHAHLAGLARGGAGLVVAEATAVSPEGRITPGCTGLWTDRQAEAFAPAVAAIKAAGAVPGIQIGHAGRQASANRPWEGDDTIAEDGPRGLEPLAPWAIPIRRSAEHTSELQAHSRLSDTTSD